MRPCVLRDFQREAERIDRTKLIICCIMYLLFFTFVVFAFVALIQLDEPRLADDVSFWLLFRLNSRPKWRWRQVTTSCGSYVYSWMKENKKIQKYYNVPFPIVYSKHLLPITAKWFLPGFSNFWSFHSVCPSSYVNKPLLFRFCFWSPVMLTGFAIWCQNHYNIVSLVLTFCYSDIIFFLSPFA